MSSSHALRLSVLGMLALSLSACSLTGNTEPTSGPTMRPSETTMPTAIATPVAMEALTDKPKAVPTSTPTTKASTVPSTPTPKASTAPTVKKEFLMSEVATHSSGTSCYVEYKGDVYDITPFIPQHPDGPKPLSKCGQSINDFSALHSGGSFDSPQVQAQIARLIVGTLKK